MKLKQLMSLVVLSLALCTASRICAQDSTDNTERSFKGVNSAVDTNSSESELDTTQKSGSGQDILDFQQENKSAQEKGTAKKVVADTLVVKAESVNQKGLGESKIEELSNLISTGNIFYTVVFLLFGFVLIKVITFILNSLAERSTKYRIAFKGSIPIVKIVGWIIIVFLIIVVIYKPSVASMLAVSASIGVAIGFASQDILKNIFGGIIILLDRPFVSGDKIEVDKYYGEVVEIGLRSTRIVTPDDSLVSVPNAVMMNSSLSNSNAGEPNCQVVAEIYLPLTVDTIKTREIATQAATVSKFIYLGKPITVLFLNEINTTHSYYKMRVKAYVMDIRDEFRFKSDMTELIITELVKEGVLDDKF